MRAVQPRLIEPARSLIRRRTSISALPEYVSDAASRESDAKTAGRLTL